MDDKRAPMDQILHAEAEVARRIAAARQAAEEAVQEAHAQTADIKSQACEAGRQQGQAQVQAAIARAEEEAFVLLEQAHRQAERLRDRGEQRMDTAVHRVAAIVIGQEEKEGTM